MLRRVLVLLAATFLDAVGAADAWAQPLDQVPPERLALLSHGINLNAWFTPWANPSSYDSRFSPDEAAFLKRAGFTFCRLPLAPDLLFDPSRPAVPRQVITSVDRAVRLLLDAGLAVVFDPIHGSSETAEWESRLDHDPDFLAKVEVYWEALARHYATFSTDHVFFEIMNEPHLSARENVAPSWWPPIQEALAAAIRRGAPASTIIATGERWGGIDGLLELKPLSDRNVVYSFHWYEPFTFTHQGASWAGPLQEELSRIPYPSSPKTVRGPAADLADQKARAQVLRYGSETWNETRVRAGIKRVADWASANGEPVFCGEFGVYRKEAPPADRLRWIRDVRSTLESFGMGWSMWDYETDFGLITYREPGWRRGIQVDSGCLSALGLDATQTLPAGLGGPTMADFVSGIVRSIDIPVDGWARLWTRDPGAGETSVEEDSEKKPIALTVSHTGSRDWALNSGLRVPVHAGEKLVLSSNASVQGAGSLSLELVARDSSEKVLDWSFARKSVLEGGLVTTEFVVPGGIATLEPRWSGSGPLRARIQAFHLVYAF